MTQSKQKNPELEARQSVDSNTMRVDRPLIADDNPNDMVVTVFASLIDSDDPDVAAAAKASLEVLLERPMGVQGNTWKGDQG